MAQYGDLKFTDQPVREKIQYWKYLAGKSNSYLLTETDESKKD